MFDHFPGVLLIEEVGELEFGLDDFLVDFEGTLLLVPERQSAAQQLVNAHSQRPIVSRQVVRLSDYYFRRSVKRHTDQSQSLVRWFLEFLTVFEVY